MYSPNRIVRMSNLIGAFVLAASTARAVSPPPDGGYANENTAEGEDGVFFSLTSAFNNTAVGFHALYSSATAGYNTALGVRALESNTSGFNNTAVSGGALQLNISGWNNRGHW